MNKTDILIIGGGVSGLLTARELAESGARICLLERQALAKESSWAGGGILSPLKPWRMPEAVTRLCRFSQGLYPQLSQTLLETTGIDPEWIVSGLIFLDDEEQAQAMPWLQQQPLESENLGQTELRSREPHLKDSFHSGLLLPEIAQVRNPRLLAALRNDLEAKGVVLLEQHPVTKLLTQGNRVTGLSSLGETWTAESFVLTAGAWSGLVAESSGLPRLPVAPVKGEMLIFKAEPGLLNCMVLAGGRYLIPRRDGRILAGSTVESAGFNKSISLHAQLALKSFALQTLPALANYPIEKHWSGLRPGSPLGIPYIGPHPRLNNLYLNCGHFRNGFVMAPASARLVADHVLHRSPSLNPTPYFPVE